MSDMSKAIRLSDTAYDISNIFSAEEIGPVMFEDRTESATVVEILDEDDPDIAKIIELCRQFRNL